MSSHPCSCLSHSGNTDSFLSFSSLHLLCFPYTGLCYPKYVWTSQAHSQGSFSDGFSWKHHWCSWIKSSLSPPKPVYAVHLGYFIYHLWHSQFGDIFYMTSSFFIKMSDNKIYIYIYICLSRQQQDQVVNACSNIFIDRWDWCWYIHHRRSKDATSSQKT